MGLAFKISSSSTSALKIFLGGLTLFLILFAPKLHARCDQLLTGLSWVSSSKPHAKVPNDEFWIYKFSDRDYGIVTSKRWFGIRKAQFYGKPRLIQWSELGIQTGLNMFVSVHRYPQNRLGDDFFRKLQNLSEYRGDVQTHPDGEQILGMISEDIFPDLEEGRSSRSLATSKGRVTIRAVPFSFILAVGLVATFVPMSATPGLDGKPASLVNHVAGWYRMHDFERTVFPNQMFDFWDSWAQAMYLESRGEAPRDLERAALLDLKNYSAIRQQIHEARNIWIYSDRTRLAEITRESRQAISNAKGDRQKIQKFLNETLPLLQARLTENSVAKSVLESQISIPFDPIANTFFPGLAIELRPKEISAHSIRRLYQSGLLPVGLSIEEIDSLRFQLYQTPIKGLEDHRINGNSITWGNLIFDPR